MGSESIRRRRDRSLDVRHIARLGDYRLRREVALEVAPRSGRGSVDRQYRRGDSFDTIASSPRRELMTIGEMRYDVKRLAVASRYTRVRPERDATAGA